MGVERFCIIFDKPDKIYNAGEMVTGRVELGLDSAMEIRAIKLRIRGKAKCMGGKKSRDSVETYLDNEQVLIEGKDKFKLPDGEYTYPFSVQLPHEAPSSFFHFDGKISYYGKATIDIPWHLNKKEKTEFTVTKPLDLNSFPNLLNPYKIEDYSSFCCMCCCFCGELQISAHLPKTGFAKSESIPITLKVNNNSSVTVIKFRVYLKRIICLITDEDQITKIVKRKTYKEEKLAKLKLEGVAARQSRTWYENLAIPSVPFPNVNGCSIIKIDHELNIQFVASDVHCDSHDVRIPVTIGDIPLSKDPNDWIVPPNRTWGPERIPTVEELMQDSP